MKICTIVGARPQFIKAAMLSKLLLINHKEVLIHTGQHYDYNMSEVFFQQLDIPKPQYNLGITGATHAKMTGNMLIAIEEVFCREKPDMVLVYGDTNSTLAGALAGVKLHIPICHIEAGVRMGTLLNPEEVNRVLCDRISSLLMCCTNVAVENLQKEGIHNGVHNVGDLMYDAVLYYSDKASCPNKFTTLVGNDWKVNSDFYLLTCHREENTFNDEALKEIFFAMESLQYVTIYPVHPRNKERAIRLCKAHNFKNIILIDPVDYLTSLWLIKNSIKVITDSGGVQREAWFLKKQCLTILAQAPWPETLKGNMNQLCQPIKEDILHKLSFVPTLDSNYIPFGEGNTGETICNILNAYS